MTNADMIRKMNDYELAELFVKTQIKSIVDFCADNLDKEISLGKETRKQLYKDTLEILQQEAI